MKKNIIRVSDKYIRSLIREAIEDTPVSTDDMGAETLKEGDEGPVDENGGQIRLSESQLREFVSYSVARLLREVEAYPRASEYGKGKEIVLEFDPWTTLHFDEVEEDVRGELGIDEDWLAEDGNNPFPVTVRFTYDISPGSKRDYTLDLPPSPDDITLKGWEIIDANGVTNPDALNFTKLVVAKFINSGYFSLESELVHKGLMSEALSLDNGIPVWFKGSVDEDGDGPKPGSFEDRCSKAREGRTDKPGSNGYKVGGPKLNTGVESKYKKEDGSWMTWDEYVEAKEREREEDERKAEKGLDPVLTGGKGGSVGGFGKRDETRLTSEDLAEMVRKTTRALMERTLREETDSLGQYHGSLRLDQEDDFARKIFAVMGDIEDQMADIERRVEADEDYDDQNTYNYYSALKSAYNALDSLAHFEDADY